MLQIFFSTIPEEVDSSSVNLAVCLISKYTKFLPALTRWNTDQMECRPDGMQTRWNADQMECRPDGMQTRWNADQMNVDGNILFLLVNSKFEKGGKLSNCSTSMDSTSPAWTLCPRMTWILFIYLLCARQVLQVKFCY